MKLAKSRTIEAPSGVTSISAYIPARRATRVDPATVLMGD
jgi:ABC-type lipoprotein release transport system permease subunit